MLCWALRAQLQGENSPKLIKHKRLVIVMLLIALALTVRFFSWQDNRRDASKVETLVTRGYEDSTRQLVRGDVRAFLTDRTHLDHPPGYPILLSALFRVYGESDGAIQILQILADSLAVFFVFLIAGELFSLAVAAIAGMLAALSPQFAYYSILLLPDSLAVLPLLVAMYFVVRALKQPRFWYFIAAGSFVGLSCWLRANALLLAPFLACLIVPLLQRANRFRYALAFVLSTAVVIAPIMIKNAIVLHRFIPLSLGAGQKLLQGIAEYDQGRFNIPKTDLGIIRQEAVMYHRPDYALFLFGQDGVERDRWRIRRGLNVIASHPFWYAGVMFRRGVSFLRLARVPITAGDPPISHGFDLSTTAPVLTKEPSELVADAIVSPQAKATALGDGQVRVESDASQYGMQIVSSTIRVEIHHDYILRWPLKLEDGRMVTEVTDESQSRILSSENVELVEGIAAKDQPVNVLMLSFISGSQKQIRVKLSNNGGPSSIAQLGHLELFDLGPSRREWMSYLRLPIRTVQKLFITACTLPLLILGIASMLWRRDFRSLILLSMVPLYYMIFQSAFHTERRYVIAIHYLVFVILAVAIHRIGVLAKQHIANRSTILAKQLLNITN